MLCASRIAVLGVKAMRCDEQEVAWKAVVFGSCSHRDKGGDRDGRHYRLRGRHQPGAVVGMGLSCGSEGLTFSLVWIWFSRTQKAMPHTYNFF